MRGRYQGLTLVELLTVVAIMAILATIVFPSFQQVYLKIRLEGVANELRTDLQYAKEESIRLRNQVSVTPTATGNGYSLTDASSNVLKSITFPTGTTAAIGPSPNVNVTFDPLRGFSTATSTVSFTLSVANLTPSITLSADPTGRVTECASNGSFYGVTAC